MRFANRGNLMSVFLRICPPLCIEQNNLARTISTNSTFEVGAHFNYLFMKKIAFISLKNFLCVAVAVLLFAVSCKSQVESYILDEFPIVVRIDNLENEIAAEIKQVKKSLNQFTSESDPNIAESQRLTAQYNKEKRSLEQRLANYQRTGNYAYIINIYPEAERAEAKLVRANQLRAKSMPYLNHSKKQIKAFTAALKAVDCKALLVSDLAKDEAVTPEYIFKSLIGVPGALATPTQEEINNLAVAALTSYFVDNPTPSVKAHTQMEDKETWRVILSNDAEYSLRAIKCDNGEYDYKYTLAE